MPIPENDVLIRQLITERAKLLALIRSIVGSLHLAEDVFQQLCLLVVEKRNEVLEMDHASPWLRTAARNLAMNARRKSASQATLLGDKIHELLEQEWGKLDRTMGLHLTDALELCLARLKPDDKQFVTGRYSDGLGYEELSQKLDRSVTALYKAMGRIQKRLADCIRRRVASLERGHA